MVREHTTVQTNEQVRKSDTLQASFYFYAAGAADVARTWGGLVAVGKKEDVYLADALEVQAHVPGCDPGVQASLSQVVPPAHIRGKIFP
jgi:hypothetical protein